MLLFVEWKARADGGGFCLCEVESAEAALEATAPWVDARVR